MHLNVKVAHFTYCPMYLVRANVFPVSMIWRIEANNFPIIHTVIRYNTYSMMRESGEREKPYIDLSGRRVTSSSEGREGREDEVLHQKMSAYSAERDDEKGKETTNTFQHISLFGKLDS
jgi:hypothetical protein